MPESRPQERRREVRRPAQGSVRLSTIQPGVYETEGELVDVSHSGFRARHGWLELSCGDTVRFAHAFARGIARVVWSRIHAASAETGFLILEREETTSRPA